MAIVFLSVVGTIGLLMWELFCYERGSRATRNETGGPDVGRRVPARSRVEWQRPAAVLQ